MGRPAASAGRRRLRRRRLGHGPAIAIHLVDASPRPLGSLGSISPLAFGCWRFRDGDLPGATGALEAALDAFAAPGARVLVDNADVYGEHERGAAEALLGRVLGARPGWADELVLATKAGIRPGVPYDASGDYLVAACEASLRRLGVETVDLFQLHRVDLYTPPEETAAALAHLREAGKIREVGVSNATVAQLDDLERHLPFPVAAVQAECSLLDRRPIFDGVLDWCRRRGTVPLAYSPLASGRLGSAGGDVPPALTVRLEALAARECRPATVVALAFLLAHPSKPVPIVGTQRPDRLAELAAATAVRLDRADVYGLIEAAQGHELP